MQERFKLFARPLPSDNELPDYIMVMLANNKTVHQINNDLQLFLGENTDRFTAWLQRAITDPAALMERDIEASQECKEGGRERERERKRRDRSPLILSTYASTYYYDSDFFDHDQLIVNLSRDVPMIHTLV